MRRAIPEPPTTWSDRIAWVLQVGWILIATAYESLFTHVPQLDSLQFSVLMVIGAAMIFLSLGISYGVYKERNRVWKERLKILAQLPPPPPE